jgi:hypothetical protein
MMLDLYNKRNERRVKFLYPTDGNKNVLRMVEGVKKASFTGPRGRGITVKQTDGSFRSFSVCKCVASLS